MFKKTKKKTEIDLNDGDLIYKHNGHLISSRCLCESIVPDPADEACIIYSKVMPSYLGGNILNNNLSVWLNSYKKSRPPIAKADSFLKSGEKLMPKHVLNEYKNYIEELREAYTTATKGKKDLNMEAICEALLKGYKLTIVIESLPHIYYNRIERDL